ncbi:MAG: hypothetical protein H6Q81_2691 [Deltaproteobacteria bacterium]|nr:hypothetical protein [Deltaproteobacteria bacterium]
MYSFRMSFWMVPFSAFAATPCFSPTAMYIASRMAAVELIVIEVETLPRGIRSNRSSMSSSESIATPTFPTSPNAIGASESYPIWVGRSKATDRPVCPCSRRYRYRRFDSFASPNPAYCRIVQKRPRYIVGCTPRVKGNSPGNPASRR